MYSYQHIQYLLSLRPKGCVKLEKDLAHPTETNLLDSCDLGLGQGRTEEAPVGTAFRIYQAVFLSVSNYVFSVKEHT
jgi:hypothetical protein